MTPSPHHRPFTRARRAAILLLVLGGLAALFGVAMIATAPKLAEAGPPPEITAQLEEFKRQQVPITFRTLLVASGVLLLVYATFAVTLGVLVRNGGRASVIVTLVLAGLVTAITAIQAGVALVSGVPGNAIFAAGPAVAHGMVVKWMIETLQRAAPAAAPLPPASRKPPLADYYVPPAPPI